MADSIITVLKEYNMAFLNVIPVAAIRQRRIIISQPLAEMKYFKYIGMIQTQEVGYMITS